MVSIKKCIPILIIALALSATFAFSGNSPQDVKSMPKDSIVVYYFYGSFRCSSCLKIEKYTKEAVNKYFKKELDSGDIIFMPVNIEEADKEHYVDDYQLYTKSVILSLIRDGKEIEYKNLSDVWQYLGDERKFYDYVKNEINKYLKNQ